MALQLDNPFAGNDNDLDRVGMQLEFNKRLIRLLENIGSPTPSLSKIATMSIESLSESKGDYRRDTCYHKHREIVVVSGDPVVPELQPKTTRVPSLWSQVHASPLPPKSSDSNDHGS